MQLDEDEETGGTGPLVAAFVNIACASSGGPVTAVHGVTSYTARAGEAPFGAAGMLAVRRDDLMQNVTGQYSTAFLRASGGDEVTASEEAAAMMCALSDAGSVTRRSWAAIADDIVQAAINFLRDREYDNFPHIRVIVHSDTGAAEETRRARRRDRAEADAIAHRAAERAHALAASLGPRGPQSAPWAYPVSDPVNRNLDDIMAGDVRDSQEADITRSSSSLFQSIWRDPLQRRRPEIFLNEAGEEEEVENALSASSFYQSMLADTQRQPGIINEEEEEEAEDEESSSSSSSNALIEELSWSS